MKTKSFFIGICFFWGITLTHVTAQKNHTEQYWVESMGYWKRVAGILVWHYNLIRDMGNHYIGILSYNYYTREFIIGKIVCK